MAAATARQSSITRGTSTKQSTAWNRWKTFLQSIDLPHDTYLQSISCNDRVLILSAFAHAIRTAEFSKPNLHRLGEDTVRNSVDHVAQTFRDLQYPDPRLDPDGKPSRLLSAQYKGYRSADPPPKQQKALPGCVILRLYKHNKTNRTCALADLCTGAFFFAMRSCEYLRVSGSNRKTKRLRLRNLRFYLNGNELPLSSNKLLSATTISVTFEDQKNDHKFDTITMHAANHKLLCPVKSWARVVWRVLSIPSMSTASFVNMFQDKSSTLEITGNDVVQSLRAAAHAIGEPSLGFKISDIGTHSIRSGAAMAMYLDEVPVYTIMLIGRWSSDAFLLYIRKQVEQFSQNVSSRMIRNLDFTHIPNFTPHISHGDPRTRNHRDNSQTRHNMGPQAINVIPTLPGFSLYS